MAIVSLLAFFGVSALIVAGAILATNLRQALHNRRLLLEIQRRRIRDDMARRLVVARKKR